MFRNKVLLVNVSALTLLAVAGALPASASGAIVGKTKAVDPPMIVMPPEGNFQQKNKTDRIQPKKFFKSDDKGKIVDPPMIVMPEL